MGKTEDVEGMSLADVKKPVVSVVPPRLDSPACSEVTHKCDNRTGDLAQARRVAMVMKQAAAAQIFMEGEEHGSVAVEGQAKEDDANRNAEPKQTQGNNNDNNNNNNNNNNDNNKNNNGNIIKNEDGGDAVKDFQTRAQERRDEKRQEGMALAGDDDLPRKKL
jgi:hypothetical protein